MDQFRSETLKLPPMDARELATALEKVPVTHVWSAALLGRQEVDSFECILPPMTVPLPAVRLEKRKKAQHHTDLELFLSQLSDGVIADGVTAQRPRFGVVARQACIGLGRRQISPRGEEEPPRSARRRRQHEG